MSGWAGVIGARAYTAAVSHTYTPTQTMRMRLGDLFDALEQRDTERLVA